MPLFNLENTQIFLNAYRSIYREYIPNMQKIDI